MQTFSGAVIMRQIVGAHGHAQRIEQTLHLWPTHVEIVGVGPLWLGSRGRMAPSQISAWFRYRARLPASDRGDDEWPAGLVAIRRAGAEANGAMWLLRISDRQAAE